MLSNIWPPDADEQKRTFYRSLSRVMLALARCPIQKIGSFTISDTGEMSLSNRPLTARLPLLEREGVPIDIPRDRCYSTTDAYCRALLNCHDLKLAHQPNSVHNKYDADAQMAVFTMMRALPSHFTLNDLRNGPCCYIWTDPHASNIFVDQHYEITSLPDLERFCSLPIEILHPTFWLSGHEVDQLGEGNIKYYDEICAEFLEIFEREDSQDSAPGPEFCTKVLKTIIMKKTHWLWVSLNHPCVTYNLFLTICSLFSRRNTWRTTNRSNFSTFWPHIGSKAQKNSPTKRCLTGKTTYIIYEDDMKMPYADSASRV